MFSSSAFLALCALFLTLLTNPVAAQTWTSCNPMNVTTCPPDPALGMTYDFNFTNPNNLTTWNTTSGTINFGSGGAEFTINKRYDSPTIQSEWYIFWGTVEVHMKAASGQGVISSIVLESDDLDEVDWEVMGGNTTTVESNYFGKGNTTLFDRAQYHPVNNPESDFHNYTTVWTSAKIEWWIDGSLVRTLNYGDADGGYNFPQTPMTVRLGIWAGGDPGNSQGTIEWAGGETDFTKGPYTMYVKSAKVTDGSTGSTYTYGDTSGSWQSIKVAAGNSTAEKTLTSGTSSSSPSESIGQKWSNLSTGAKVAVYAGAAAVGTSLLALLSFCCWRQRRRGRMEREAYEAKLEAEQAEAQAYQMELKGRSVDSLPNSATPAEYAGSRSGTPAVPPVPAAFTGAAAGGAAAGAAGAAIARSGSASPGAASATSPRGLGPQGQQQQGQGIGMASSTYGAGGLSSPREYYSPTSPPPPIASPYQAPPSQGTNRGMNMGGGMGYPNNSGYANLNGGYGGNGGGYGGGYANNGYASAPNGGFNGGYYNGGANGGFQRGGYR